MAQQQDAIQQRTAAARAAGSRSDSWQVGRWDGQNLGGQQDRQKPMSKTKSQQWIANARAKKKAKKGGGNN